MNVLSERAKLRLLLLLLLLMLGFLAFTTATTLQAAQNFQRQYSAVKTEDVNAIHPWMSIHVISHLYHIPEDYLYSSLNISNTATLHHATLYDLANHSRQSPDQVIHTLRYAILKYRKEHHPIVPPLPLRHTRRQLLPTPGGTQY
ncbi:MAG: hypothetical protein ABI396_03820 [Ktedonobacteraceae bacterium]